MYKYKRYDIVLDATDNVATRYLLNDACVLARKPLVSGSALRFEGQLTVYNCDGGPCYRCLFPQPPPPETVTNCSEGGVIGVVPGIIGSMQALEAIKIASGIGSSYTQRLLLFDALDGTFRSVKLRPRSPTCIVCGNEPSITQLIDYIQFCGAAASDKEKELTVLDQQFRINAKEYQAMLTCGEPHLLLDVRPEVELGICQLPHASLNIPLAIFNKDASKATKQVLQWIRDLEEKKQEFEQQQESSLSHSHDAAKALGNNHSPTVVCVCRRGNDSQLVVRRLQEELKIQISCGELSKGQQDIKLVDIKGGLHAWARHVDREFPIY
ncbi:adenylyltransferase and sulfurtransferase MOCS3 [Elysia marginata]|uniref:Adenylyltransferase and sulfurtransferase MOCS3 n=1 Tax=Elysia marginata TaxID=1093978 RepID=A0AAV4GT85_9GAST|nr:adenylyltransferase and sulfurtransferase MOCS3 [Elysia marginata]